MDHRDHVALLRPGVIATTGAIWADLGAGTGAFTLALADLLGPGATIVAVDRDGGALRTGVDAVVRRFPDVIVRSMVADIATLAAEGGLPQLDGIVAANSLHFLARERQTPVVAGLSAALRPGASFVVVEYDADRGNPWVPNPFSARSWPRLATDAGLVRPRELARVPSRFLGAIYSAAADRPAVTEATAGSSTSIDRSTSRDST